MASNLLPSDAGTRIFAVPVRHVKLDNEETRKLVGRWWDWGVVGRYVITYVADWVFVFCDSVAWCIEEGDWGY